MVNYACAFTQSETEKYFERTIITFILLLQEKEMQNHISPPKNIITTTRKIFFPFLLLPGGGVGPWRPPPPLNNKVSNNIKKLKHFLSFWNSSDVKMTSFIAYIMNKIRSAILNFSISLKNRIDRGNRDGKFCKNIGKFWNSEGNEHCWKLNSASAILGILN